MSNTIMAWTLGNAVDQIPALTPTLQCPPFQLCWPAGENYADYHDGGAPATQI